ncbi:MAG: beta-ketoacyl-[acyl-carrier-protein] synthase family protein [Bacteroidetes bacterium]|nr:MAG: beta-ketoacyl-[acyl-carrier-protein] synthase family protein [Bacteroidota bacterium]
MREVVVTGMGVISPLGVGLAAQQAALRAGVCALDVLSLFPTKYARRLRFGEVKIPNEELAGNLSVQQAGVTRTSLLALAAFEEAITHSGLHPRQLSEAGTALVGATTVGGICLTDELYRDARSQSGGSPYLAAYDCGSVNLFLQQRFQIGGIINTIHTACSSSANAIMYGARLIEQGFAQRAIVGGTDSLAKFTINGFNALHILSAGRCRPFDAARDGLNLGEGAAFLVLERAEDAAHKTIYARLSGYANTNDAYHPSSLSEAGTGPLLAMQLALQRAGLSPADIDFINAHGTGTENNDLVESRAICRLFPQVPPFASSKSNIGHTLGAAGAIEAVFGILSLYGQEVFPSLNFEQPIPETGLRPVLRHAPARLRHLMSNSFGFGGNCSSLIFSKA